MRRALLPPVLLSVLCAVGLAFSDRSALASSQPVPSAAAETHAGEGVAQQLSSDRLPLVKTAFNLLFGGYEFPLRSDALLGDAWDGVNKALSAADQAPLPQPQFSGDPQADWLSFATAYQAVQSSNVIPATDLAYGAIGQMAAARNSCHTAFLPPGIAASTNGASSHQPTAFTGYVADRDSNVVMRVYPDSPAERAGLRPGDTLLTSAGQAGPNLRRRIAATPPGSPIELTVRRPGLDAPVPVTLVPELTVLPFVRTQVLPGGVGVLQWDFFTSGQGLVDAVRRALQEFEAQGVTGWILDLRTSPGGDGNTLGGLAGLLLKSGHVATLVDRFGGRMEQDADPVVTFPAQRPLVILTEHYSASAADIFPGALQNDGRAYLIGDTTDGCISSSREVSLSDGSLLQLQTDGVLIGNDRLELNGVGITPNERVLRSPESLAAGEDLQMDAAVRYLTGSAGR